MTRSIAFVLGLLVVLAVEPRALHAQDVAQNAALALRVLSYDRSVPTRAAERVTVLVTYRAADQASEAEQRRMVSAINQLAARVRVSGLPTRAVAAPYTNRAALVQAMRREGATALFVCGGLAREVAEISGATREVRVLSMTREEAGVRGGLSVGFVPRGAQVQLLVNLRAVEPEGARLDAAMLRLAELIR